METKEKHERFAYLDYLRVLATFGVVLLHVSAWNWTSATIGGFEWKVLSFLVFVISFLIAFPIRQLVGLANRGLLLLKKRLSPKKEAVDMKG